MKARRYLLAWLGLVLPTLAVGALALGLLVREQERLDDLARESARAQAQTVADNLDLIMAEIKDGVMQALAAASGPGDEQARLKQLVEENPFATEYVVWSPRKTGDFEVISDGPSNGVMSTYLNPAEPPWERRLPTSDFSSLQSSLTNEIGDDNISQMDIPQQIQSSYDNYGQSKMNRQAIRDISNSNVQSINALKQQEVVQEVEQQQSLLDLPQQVATQARASADIYGIFDDASEAHSGWLARNDGQPGWLAWYQRTPGGRVTGVLLDIDAVLAQLSGAFPLQIANEVQYGLTNNTGGFVYSKLEVHSSYSEGQLKLGPELPGWTLIYRDSRGLNGSGFLILGGLLVAVLCAVTLTAGTLLFRQARRDALEAARKTTFVSNVSHELRTPLTTIRMYSEMLEEGRVADDEKRHRYLGAITAESQRLTRLVDNVLDFSRLEQGRKKYRREPVDVAVVVDSVLESQGPRLREAEMEVTWQPPAEPVVVDTDRDALGQVLLNLVDNALKYAASGKQLSLAVDRKPGAVQISVADAGPGIPSKDSEKVFKAFQRLDESLTTTQPGSGLGLSICRGLTRDLGGDVYLEPANPGCRFVINLLTNFKQEERKGV